MHESNTIPLSHTWSFFPSWYVTHILRTFFESFCFVFTVASWPRRVVGEWWLAIVVERRKIRLLLTWWLVSALDRLKLVLHVALKDCLNTTKSSGKKNYIYITRSTEMSALSVILSFVISLEAPCPFRSATVWSKLHHNQTFGCREFFEFPKQCKT